MLEITKFLFFHAFYVAKPKPTSSKKSKGTSPPCFPSSLPIFPSPSPALSPTSLLSSPLLVLSSSSHFFSATPLPKVLGVPLRVASEEAEKHEENGKEENGKAKEGALSGAVRTQVQQLFFKVLVHCTSVITGLLSFCLFVFLSFCLFVFLSFCLFVFLSFCLFVFLSFCLVFLSFCLFCCQLRKKYFIRLYLFLYTWISSSMQKKKKIIKKIIKNNNK
jgi:hypothetical protein